MASENNLTAVFTDIANAIRDKKGTINTIKPINMADEINSIQVGDTNFKDLVERTMTSVDDDTITKVGDNAFRNCNNLTNVKLKSATSLNRYSFQECYKLTKVDLYLVETINLQAFYYCQSLTTLILRKTNKVCTLSNTNALTGTLIATSSTEGYIYVPDNLVEQYKVATNWSTYASKIKGLSELPTE